MKLKSGKMGTKIFYSLIFIMVLLGIILLGIVSSLVYVAGMDKNDKQTNVQFLDEENTLDSFESTQFPVIQLNNNTNNSEKEVIVLSYSGGGGSGRSTEIECYEPASCGDGKVNLPGEECDDGNLVNGDGCDKHCKIESNNGCSTGNDTWCKGKINDACIAGGFDFAVVKWEWNKTLLTWIPEGGDDKGTSVNGTDSSADWDAGNSGADGIIIKAANNCRAINGTNGTQKEIENCELSFILFCGYNVTEFCGDGVKQDDEECDDGNDIDNDECRNDCTLPKCGDGIVNALEECELPNIDNNPFCNQTTQQCLGYKLGVRDALGFCSGSCGCVEDNFEYSCVKDECGAQCGSDSDCGGNSCDEDYNDYCDGRKLVDYNANKIKDSLNIKDECENTCDLVNDCSCSDCEVSCTAEPLTYCVKNVCGADCTIDADCDDGDENTIDTCNPNCCNCEHKEISHCGDGKLDDGEECDDGNNDNGDGCSTDCVIELCGDGVVNNVDEECDDGNTNNEDACRNDCTLPKCGDGILDALEECDLGEDNGEVCEPPYDICEYCSEDCETITLYDGYCGDNEIQEYYEECEEDIDCDDYNEMTINICSKCSCEYEEISCNENSDCGEDGFLENPFCVCTTNVWDLWVTYKCKNPGTPESYCTNSSEMKLKNECGQDYCGDWQNTCYNNDVYKEKICYDNGCSSGECFKKEQVTKEKVEECYSDYCEGYWNYYCEENDVYRNRTCYLRGCEDAGCYNNPTEEEELYRNCEGVCENGRCKNVECYDDSGCAEDGWLGNEFCWCGKLFDYLIDNSCIKGGTAESYCGNSVSLMIKDENGCGSNFLTELSMTGSCW
jgi:cysteine-rich repeat protein